MAFRNLIGGIRWKLEFIKYDFLCRGFRFHPKFIKPSMITNVPTNTTYIHKMENNIVRFTIFLQSQSSERHMVIVKKGLETSVFALLEQVNFQVGKVWNNIASQTDQKEDKVNALLLLNGEPLDMNACCSTIFNLVGELRLRLFHNYYTCLLNKPFVILIKITENPVSGTFIYPLELQTIFTDKCDIKWFRSSATDPQVLKNKSSWIQVGEGFHYLIQDDDACHYLKLECVPLNGDIIGPCFQVMAKSKVESKFCSYYYLNIHELTKEEVKEDMFRLVTYNILANFYACTKLGKQIFGYCPKFALEKNQRISAIAIELIGYNSDLICLQEVDKDIYVKFLLPLFEELDYNGKMCCKLTAPEGTACFYRKRKFTLLTSEKFNFGVEIKENYHLRDILHYVQNNDELFHKCTTLQHSLQLVALQSKAKTDEVLIVGNVHLYSNPEATVIRILHAVATFRLLKYTLEQLKPMISKKNVSFIFCGDFNSLPTSPIHDYIKNSKLPENMEKDVNMEDFTSFRHSLNMESAYGMQIFTNYTEDFQGCLDYIYYERDRLEVDKIYPTADEQELSRNVGIPSITFPSDHVPLIVDFKWK